MQNPSLMLLNNQKYGSPRYKYRKFIWASLYTIVSNEKWDISGIKGYCNQVVGVETAELANNRSTALNSNKSNNKGLPCLY